MEWRTIPSTSSSLHVMLCRKCFKLHYNKPLTMAFLTLSIQRTAKFGGDVLSQRMRDGSLVGYSATIVSVSGYAGGMGSP